MIVLELWQVVVAIVAVLALIVIGFVAMWSIVHIAVEKSVEQAFQRERVR